jgi:predicted CoA-binding protein
VKTNNLHIVLGASKNPDRMSHRALSSLLVKGYSAFGVHPSGIPLFEQETFKNLNDIEQEIDTLTLYISAKHQGGLFEDILNKDIKRVIFNPGTENPVLMEELLKANINAFEACTMVLLNTDQY